ncbi:hypothetical protein C8R42DRAFT_724656 [Lentinula raphanica]|nr:hypothetical protein C8R42DRAFT_724656 [Lentinula raphanica]
MPNSAKSQIAEFYSEVQSRATYTHTFIRAQIRPYVLIVSQTPRPRYKKERKGAIRELRKDARFLAGVERAKQKEKVRSYNEHMKRAFGSLEGERAEEKASEREKAKEKKRAGRK